MKPLLKPLASLPFRPVAAGILAGSLLLAGCDKKPATSADAAVEAVTPEAAASAYGFAARVPASAESAVGLYRLGSLWDRLASSRWVAVATGLKAVQGSPEIQEFLTQWRTNPQAQQAKEIVSGLLGEELVVVGAPGTGDALGSLIDAVQGIQSGAMVASMQPRPATGPDGEPDLSSPGSPGANPVPTQAALMIPLLVKAEVPPVYFASKAAKIREHIDQGAAQLVEKLKSQPPPAVSVGTATAGGHEFQVISFDGAALVEAMGDQIDGMLSTIEPDPAKAAALRAALERKKVALGWGWVDDYLVVSLGPDLSHVAFVDDPAKSVLSNAPLAKAAAGYAAKQPLAITYVKASISEAVQRPFKIADLLTPFLPAAVGILDASDIETITNEAKAFDERYAPQWKSEFTDSAGVIWWEDGLRAEGWGGVKCAKDPEPLTFASLTTPATLLTVIGNDETGPTSPLNGRQWIEDLAKMAFSWYSDIVKAKLPPESAGQAGMAESIVLPAVQDLWKATGLLGEALGAESAFVVDGAGSLPTIPGMDAPPAFVESARIPRLAIVAGLKDRAKLSESWALIQGIIDRFAMFIPPDQLGGLQLKPVSRKVGDAEVFHFQLPMDIGDFLPHTAVAGNTWVMGTAPSYAGEIAAASGSPGDPAHFLIHANPVAVADLLETWYKAALATPEIGGSGNAEFEAIRADAEPVLKLIRAFGGIDLRVHADESGTRTSGAIHWKDVD